jgi:hypothetical protein
MQRDAARPQQNESGSAKGATSLSGGNKPPIKNGEQLPYGNDQQLHDPNFMKQHYDQKLARGHQSDVAPHYAVSLANSRERATAAPEGCLTEQLQNKPSRHASAAQW